MGDAPIWHTPPKRPASYSGNVEPKPISAADYFALTDREKLAVPRDTRWLPIGYWLWSQEARNRYGRENPRTQNAGPPRGERATSAPDESPDYLTEEEWQDLVRTSADDNAAKPEKPKPKARGRKQDGNGQTHADGFVRGDGDQILKGNPDNIRHAIDLLGVKLKHDAFSNQPKIWGLPGYGAGVELTDPTATRIRFLIGETYFFLPPKELFEDVLIDIAHLNRFHPVREWLDSKTWDCVPRIDNWLRDYGGADDTPFNKAVGRIFLVAGVRRVRRPGCKFDTMLVLEGSQGRNKSQGAQLIAVHPEWFTDGLQLGSDPKVVIEQCQGNWIIECAELTGIHTRELETIKAFLSRQTDKARAAYGRRSETVPRQFVCIGTTNDKEYLLRDERRFWPVLINKFDLDALHRDVPQLWAEAGFHPNAGLFPVRYAQRAHRQSFLHPR